MSVHPQEKSSFGQKVIQMWTIELSIVALCFFQSRHTLATALCGSREDREVRSVRSRSCFFREIAMLNS
jgi:hypothetical protein